jgi:hypothetical protein
MPSHPISNDPALPPPPSPPQGNMAEKQKQKGPICPEGHLNRKGHIYKLRFCLLCKVLHLHLFLHLFFHLFHRFLHIYLPPCSHISLPLMTHDGRQKLSVWRKKRQKLRVWHFRCTRPHTHTHIHIYIHIYVCIYIYIYPCMHMFIHVYIYISFFTFISSPVFLPRRGITNWSGIRTLPATKLSSNPWGSAREPW